MKLFDEHLTACASPDFMRCHPIESTADLANLPLLQLETRPTAWSAWFEGQGATPLAKTGMLMDQFSMMIQAAISGLGIALLPDYLAWAEIAEGRLLPVLQPSVPGAGSYWLAWPEAKDRYGPLRAFRNWMAAPEPRIEASA
jgi:LysR family glycine cleavage system transcriptional activator